jgi:hypothetical protein
MFFGMLQYLPRTRHGFTTSVPTNSWAFGAKKRNIIVLPPHTEQNIAAYKSKKILNKKSGLEM